MTTFEKVNNLKLNYSFGNACKGDIPIIYANIYANCDKINKDIGWCAKKSLSDMCIDSYRYYKYHKNLDD